MTKNLYFVSLGCTRNQVDSETMIAKLIENNFLVTNEVESSDVFVVNTCGFLKESRDEAYLILDEILKNKKKDSKIIITGCMANLFSDEIKEKYGTKIFSIISSGNLDKILDATKEKTFDISSLSYLSDDRVLRTLITPKHLAYVKISEGCSKACSFCIIPKIKGPLKSRSIDSIISEINILLENGVFEINLIAQDLLDYGKDRSEKNAFITLLKEILKINKKFWLRLLYVYPDEITEEFIDLLASDERICKYLDIPLQHVSDNILRKMKRKTTSIKIKDLFQKLRSKIKNISIRTSLMVGFPNESEDDFEKLLDFIKENQIDHLAVFKYSNEENAQSYTYENQIPEDIKQKRFEALTKLQADLVQKRNKKLIGSRVDTLIDGYHSESNLLCSGRSFGQAYSVDSNIIINDIRNIKKFGKIQKIKITGISGYDLIGKPI